MRRGFIVSTHSVVARPRAFCACALSRLSLNLPSLPPPSLSARLAALEAHNAALTAELEALAQERAIARGAASPNPIAVSVRYDRGVDTASRSSRYPGRSAGPVTASVSTSA